VKRACGRRGDWSTLSLKRADARLALRIGPKPNADRSGEWPMDIIEHHTSPTVPEEISLC
jgi:hypothetical protein